MTGVCLLTAVAVAVTVCGIAGAARAQSSPAAPRRIVSLVPALTEMLFAIGAGPQVVAVSSFDTHPPEVSRLPKVGALLDPDVERVLALTPDLVAVYASQTDLKRQLARASIAVFDYRHAGLADVFTTMRALGARTGHAARADEVARQLEQRIAAAGRAAAARPRPRVLLVFGRESGALRNVYASGGRGFLHDMLTAAGGTNVFADVAQESVQATTELVLARAPDVILELHERSDWTAADTAAAQAVWDRLAAVPAVKRGRVLVLAGEGLVVPGPRVAAAVERIAAALHPGGQP
ncbi:MAG: ABC transporter substrate-binding protein [Vicinamibacterales bacterium]